MKKRKSIGNGILVLLISQVLVKIFGLLYKLYLANKNGFGDVGNAIYNSGYQIYALLLTVSSIGVPNAVAKLIAENKNSKEQSYEIFRNSLILFAVIGATGSVLLAIFAKYIAKEWLNIPEASKSIIALSPAIFNVCIISVYRGYYNGIGYISTTAKSQSIEQLLKTVFTVMFVEITFLLTRANTEYMAAFANFATTIATLGSFIYLYKKNSFCSIKCKWKKRNFFKILYISLPISIGSILTMLSKNIDSVMIVRYLKRFMGEQNAKVEYGILSGKVDVLCAVPVSFIIAITTTIIPTVSVLAKEKKYSEISKVMEKYMLVTLLAVLPCCILIMMFSKQILFILFGNTKGEILFKISSVAIVFISMEQIIHAVLQGIGKMFVPMFSLAIGILVKIFINMKLLKLSPGQYWYGGTVGSCIATLSCHLVVFFISFTALIKKLKINLKIFKILLKPIYASCIMALCLHYTYFLLKGIIIENIAIIVATTVATIVYIISLILFKILSKDVLSSVPVINVLFDWKNEK